MSRVRIASTKLPFVLWVAGLSVCACTGVGLETPDQPAAVKQERPATAGEPLDDGESTDESPRPGIGGEPASACRAIVRRGDEVVLAFASGEESVLDRNATWQKAYGQVWALGDHAIVGVPESEFSPVYPPIAAFALVHATHGVLWRGTAQAGDYARSTGFRSFTREGFVVVSDARAIDPTGAEHAPIDGFLPATDSIDEDGFILVERDGELAYWNVRADQLDVSVTAGVGTPITEIVQLGGLYGDASAFVEEHAAGELSFTQLSRNGAARAVLSAELADRFREWLLAEEQDYPAVTTSQNGNGALLIVDRRPMAWAGADAAPHTFAEWSTLPASHGPQSAGGCFSGAPSGARSADELLAGLWRVQADTGALEMGLRFAVPSGLHLVIPDPLETWSGFPEPICAGEGRMAVMLSGPDGFAWFAEGDAAFEQLTPWGEQESYYPAEELSARQARRIVGPFDHWYPAQATDPCELGYDETGRVLMTDHRRNLERLFPPDANAALLDP